MKVKRLLVKHVKGVREIEIHAHPTVNEVAGKNGAGKSSVLDSIVYALAGRRAVDARALREGEAKGLVEIDLDGKLTVTRKFKEGKDSTLTVKAADGGKIGQRDLDAMWNEFSFDPLKFSRMKPTEQIETLRQIAGKEYAQALAAKDAELQEVFVNRQLVNRQLSSFGRLEPVEEVEEVEVAAVAQELREAEEFNREQDHIEATKARAEMDVDELSYSIQALQAQLAQAQKEKVKRLARFAELPNAQPRKDTAPLHARLAEAGAKNKQAEAFRAYRAQLEKQQELARQSEDLDRIVSKLREEREKLAKSASLPMPGLTFSDSGIRLDGRPFENLSSSEQIRVSARIGMASSAELKIMLVKDGSLLDDKSWKELVAMAEENDFQVWVESVGTGHGDAVILEEGEIDPEATEQARKKSLKEELEGVIEKF